MSRYQMIMRHIYDIFIRHTIIYTNLFSICIDSSNNTKATVLFTVSHKMTTPHWSKIT